jgi:hypothetical protein
MQVQQERLLRPRVAVDRLDRAITEQVGHVAVPLDRNLALMELSRLGAAAGCIPTMIEIVGGARINAEELVVAALERAVIGQKAEVPLADQAGGIAGLLEDGR